MEKIFYPFYKVPDEKHTNAGGTGIGLSLAKSLAEKHGGSVEVKSTLNQETVFVLLIPYEPEGAAVAELTVSGEAAADADEGRPVVMVVDDDASLAEFIAKSLHGEGYRTLSCRNGSEASQQLETATVELIVSDLMMPEMDGIELCRRVKTNIANSHIPFILLTAKGNSDAEIAGIESGADAYITKPFKWKHLAATAKQLLESRQTLKRKFGNYPFADVESLTTNNHDKEFLETLTAIIEKRLTDSQFSVEELGREMAMSRSTLHKKLKGISGQPPNEFIRLIR